MKRENRSQQINAGTKENINMRELNVNEIEQVNGGILPLIIAVVIADASLIGIMVSSGLWDK